jgi:hypothetical protein
VTENTSQLVSKIEDWALAWVALMRISSCHFIYETINQFVRKHIDVIFYEWEDEGETELGQSNEVERRWGHLLMMADIKGFGNVQLVSQLSHIVAEVLHATCGQLTFNLNPLNFLNSNLNEGEDLFEKIGITLTFGVQHSERCRHAHPP